jgi:hypothetical protein
MWHGSLAVYVHQHVIQLVRDMSLRLRVAWLASGMYVRQHVAPFARDMRAPLHVAQLAHSARTHSAVHITHPAYQACLSAHAPPLRAVLAASSGNLRAHAKHSH